MTGSLAWHEWTTAPQDLDSRARLSLEYKKHKGAYHLSAVKILQEYPSTSRSFVSSGRLEMLFNLLERLSNPRGCGCEFDFGHVYPDYDYHIALREEMMLKIPPEYSASVVRFSCNGKTMCDIGSKAIAWMLSDTPSFDLDSTVRVPGNGIVCVVSW